MLPTFVVIGAGRSGTTSLHEILGRHPDVAMCRHKSPNHFATDEPQPEWETPAARAMAAHWVRDRSDYEALFDHWSGERAIGEASPVYLQATGVAARLHDALPDARLVAVLRDPVERAHAHFVGRRRDGIEPEADFAAVVERELAGPLPDAVAFGHYLGCGRYAHFLSPYLDRFPRAAVRVHLYDDLVADPAAVVRDVLEHVGVDPDVELDLDTRLNRSGIITNPVARWAWTRSVGIRTRLRPHLPAAVRRAAGAPFLRRIEKPAIDPALRARMLEVLGPDIEALQALLDRDLSAWLRS